MRGLPKATAILVCVAALVQLLLSLTDCQAYLTYKDDPQSWDGAVNVPLLAVFGVVMIAVTITFIVWLRQVRNNAERFCQAPHRHGREWVIAGWFVPIVSLWYPKQIVDDIVAASSPRTSPQAVELPRMRTRVVQVWWVTWIAGNLIGLADPTGSPDNPAASDLLQTAGFSIVSAVLTVVSAVYAVRVIRLIENYQALKPRTAWWETSELYG